MPCFFFQVSVEGVMGNIQANDPDADGSANFDVVNLRADGQYKVILRLLELSTTRGEVGEK